MPVLLFVVTLMLLVGGATAHGNGTRVARATADTPVLEFELSPTWTHLEWTGPGGVYIDDALREGGLLEKVVVVYHWDEFTRIWLAFFPSLGNVPGLNSLTAFEWGETYWIAVTEPVTWIIETPPPPATEQEAAVQLARLLPWFGTHSGARYPGLSEVFIDLWIRDTRLANDVASITWVRDLSRHHEVLLRGLIEVAAIDREVGRQLAGSAWITDDVTGDEWTGLMALYRIAGRDIALAATVTGAQWFADDLSPNEWSTLLSLESILARDLGLAREVANLSWFTDGITEAEQSLIVAMSDMVSTDPELARWVVGLPWFTDAVTGGEWLRVSNLNKIAAQDLELARSLADLRLAGDLSSHLLRSLGQLADLGSSTLAQVAGQPWFQDGLDEGEAALVVTLGTEANRNGESFTTLLRSHYIQSKAVSLPLTGNVNIWVFQSTPFSSEEDFPSFIADSLYYLEGFMESQLPTNSVIVLLRVSPQDSGASPEDQGFFSGHDPIQEYESGNTSFAGTAAYDPTPSRGSLFLETGVHLGTHIQITRAYVKDSAFLKRVITHELAHYYYFRPSWLNEGFAHFMEGYVGRAMGNQSMVEHRAEAQTTVQRDCSRDDVATIMHALFVDEHFSQVKSPGSCTRALGLLFLDHAFEVMGEEHLAAALRDLAKRGQTPEKVEEETVYRTFLLHTPPAAQEDFRNLYLGLHGGAHVDPDLDRTDDHGDSVESATDFAVGQVMGGVLDYGFDFDYFHFEAEEDQKFRIEVRHETLGAWGVMVFSDDIDQLLKSRRRASSGPVVQWVAERSDSYYVAVLNLKGDTGRYTIEITAVPDVADDHGDTAETATSISAGETVHGVVDDDFDLDYFRLDVVAGKSYEVRITGASLGDCCATLLRRPGVGEGTDHFGWWEVTTGERFLIVHGGPENTGPYTLEVLSD